MRRLFPLVCLLVAVLSGCAAPRSCALVPAAGMRLHRFDDLMFVTAWIGTQPVRMLVDTGAQRTVLTRAEATRLRLPRDTRHMTRSFGIGGMSANPDVLVPGIILGHTRFPVSHLAVADFALALPGGPSIGGLLGADILLAFDMDIDEPGHRLTLYRARRCPHARPPWTVPAIRIKGVRTRLDRMLVPFRLDGIRGTAILDTGAQATTIGMPMARRLGLSSAALGGDRRIEVHGAAPHPLAAHVHRFRRLRIGDVTIADPTLAVVPGPAGMGDGLIGGDFLRGRRVWLAFAAHRLFVSGPARPAIASRP